MKFVIYCLVFCNLQLYYRVVIRSLSVGQKIGTFASNLRISCFWAGSINIIFLYKQVSYSINLISISLYHSILDNHLWAKVEGWKQSILLCICEMNSKLVNWSCDFYCVGTWLLLLERWKYQPTMADTQQQIVDQLQKHCFGNVAQLLLMLDYTEEIIRS